MAEAETQEGQLEEAYELLAAAGGDPLQAICLLLEKRRVLEARLQQLNNAVSTGYVRGQPLTASALGASRTEAETSVAAVTAPAAR